MASEWVITPPCLPFLSRWNNPLILAIDPKFLFGFFREAFSLRTQNPRLKWLEKCHPCVVQKQQFLGTVWESFGPSNKDPIKGFEPVWQGCFKVLKIATLEAGFLGPPKNESICGDTIIFTSWFWFCSFDDWEKNKDYSSTKSRWWFQIGFFMFTPKPGEDSHFDKHIFWDGLVQPPIRKGSWIS